MSKPAKPKGTPPTKELSVSIGFDAKPLSEVVDKIITKMADQIDTDPAMSFKKASQAAIDVEASYLHMKKAIDEAITDGLMKGYMPKITSPSVDFTGLLKTGGKVTFVNDAEKKYALPSLSGPEAIVPATVPTGNYAKTASGKVIPEESSVYWVIEAIYNPPGKPPGVEIVMVRDVDVECENPTEFHHYLSDAMIAQTMSHIAAGDYTPHPELYGLPSWWVAVLHRTRMALLHGNIVLPHPDFGGCALPGRVWFTGVDFEPAENAYRVSYIDSMFRKGVGLIPIEKVHDLNGLDLGAPGTAAPALKELWPALTYKLKAVLVGSSKILGAYYPSPVLDVHPDLTACSGGEWSVSPGAYGLVGGLWDTLITSGIICDKVLPLHMKDDHPDAPLPEPEPEAASTTWDALMEVYAMASIDDGEDYQYCIGSIVISRTVIGEGPDDMLTLEEADDLQHIEWAAESYVFDYSVSYTMEVEYLEWGVDDGLPDCGAEVVFGNARAIVDHLKEVFRKCRFANDLAPMI